MALGADDINEQIDIDKLRAILRKIQAPIHLSFLRQPTQKVKKNIPFISQFLLGADNPGAVVIDIGQKVSKLPSVTVSSSVTTGFMFGDIAMSIVDFIKVPLVYLSAYLLGEKVPINLNNNARWLYSAILLGMTILAYAVPVTATPLGFIGASLGLTVAVYLLGQAIWNRYKLTKEKNKLVEQIKGEMVVIDALQDRAKALEESLNSQEQPALAYQITQLQAEFLAQKQKVDDLKNKKLDIEDKINNQNTMKVIDRSLTVTLASLTMIGLAVSLYFPGVGAGLLLGVAVAGGAYVIGRIAFSVGAWAYNKYSIYKERKRRQEGKDIVNESTLSSMIELVEFPTQSNNATPSRASDEPPAQSGHFFLSKIPPTKNPKPSQDNEDDSFSDEQGVNEKPKEP
ncbi:coiled-coil protein [Legionella waltersii]|uniref:Coiled-coil protein n=2 Tax=Legionella waltersii TaxID=66969 RepID=A0A0W1A4U6_9GAMM|nr:coiled-coil protein [Legionella waltersii]SNV13519.1 coiled-coil protein [Legionella waltersii]